jgi:hypothetical protein
MMTQCTLCKNIKIVPGSYADYKQLARYHYRDSGPKQFTSIYVLKFGDHNSSLVPRTSSLGPVGIITYSAPSRGQDLRNIATGNFFSGLDRSSQLELLNKSVRRISRVIIEPRFRGLGLASRLVAETMPLQNIPLIEAVYIMGWVHPFFEKAGMKAFHAPAKESNIRLTEALSAVGIENMLDPSTVHHKIKQLSSFNVIASLPHRGGAKQSLSKVEFIESEFRRFLKSDGHRRYCRPSLERTTFILSRLSERPVYYIWFNSKLALNVHGEARPLPRTDRETKVPPTAKIGTYKCKIKYNPSRLKSSLLIRTIRT